jgi:hypothetical protein
MNTGRHALHLTDDQLAIFQAESGNEVRLDSPLSASSMNPAKSPGSGKTGFPWGA